MTDLRTAAQQALEAMISFESGTGGLYEGEFSAEIAALRAALAEPVQDGCDYCNQPLYAATKCRVCGRATEPSQERHFCSRCGKRTNGIHTCTPPAPLTDEVIADLWHKNGGFHHHFARAIERWLRGHA